MSRGMEQFAMAQTKCVKAIFKVTNNGEIPAGAFHISKQDITVPPTCGYK